MLLVPIKYPLEHISPSSLSTWLSCPYRFYLEKVSPFRDKIRRKKSPQSRPAGAGNSFDIHVKQYLSEYFGGEFDFESEINRNLSNGKILEEMMTVGRKLFNIYAETALPYLVEEGYISSFEEEIKDYVGDAVCKGVMDSKFDDGPVLDWKVRGYASSPKSPTAGWIRCWKKGKLLNKTHPRCEDWFEEINESWARQITIYNFILGHQPGDELIAAIDEVSMRKVFWHDKISKDSVQVSQIRSKISPQFQHQVFDEVQTCWRMFNDIVDQQGKTLYIHVPQPNPCKQICHAYAKKCDAADYCDAYKQAFDDPLFAALL